jgi:hypothetical protein
MSLIGHLADVHVLPSVRFAPQAVFKARMRPLDEKVVILKAKVESQLSA